MPYDDGTHGQSFSRPVSFQALSFISCFLFNKPPDVTFDLYLNSAIKATPDSKKLFQIYTHHFKALEEIMGELIC